MSIRRPPTNPYEHSIAPTLLLPTHLRDRSRQFVRNSRNRPVDLIGEDLVVGAFTGYDFNTIKPWVYSLERSGYAGLKCAIVYNSDASVVEQLTKLNFGVLHFNYEAARNCYLYKEPFGQEIVVLRFLHSWTLISKLLELTRLRYCVITDVRDLVFQSDPSRFLLQLLKRKRLIVGCESVQYSREPWGKDNMKRSFGSQIYDYMCDKAIYNAGCLGGYAQDVADLCLNVFLMCEHNGCYDPDQAALNILLSLAPYRRITKFCAANDAWAFQAGTMADPKIRAKIGPYMLADELRFDGTHIYNSRGQRYCILHQYDRIPEWRRGVHEYYGRS